MSTRTNCIHPLCDRLSKWGLRCHAHGRQFAEYGETWDIGSRNGQQAHRCQHEACLTRTKTTFCPEHRADMGKCQVLGCEEFRRSLRVDYCDAHCRANRSFKHSYGITLHDRDALLVAQDFCCAICGKRKVLHLDHCHETGTVRGMICGNCNRGIGLLDHDLDTLRGALAYLEGR